MRISVRQSSVGRTELALTRASAGRARRHRFGYSAGLGVESAVVGADFTSCAVEANGAAVRNDPLRSGVSEWHPHTDDGIGAIPGDLFDDGLSLSVAPSSALICGWDDRAQFTHRGAGDQNASNGNEDAPLTESAHPALHLICCGKLLTRFEQKNRPCEVCDAWHPVGESDLVNDLDTPTPGRSLSYSLRSSPDSRFGRLTRPELGQSARIGPRNTEVLRLARFGEFDDPSIQQRRTQR